MATDRPSMAERIAAVKARLPIADVISRTVKLGGSAGSKARRGKCPFHSGKSASFAVNGDQGFAHCFGCQWHGDVIGFVRDSMGLDFGDALAECERMAGLSAAGSAGPERGPIQRERSPGVRRERTKIETIELARWIWAQAAPDAAAVRRYFMGRGIPAGVLTEARLGSFRYLAKCPLAAWDVGGAPSTKLMAPAIAALVVKPVMTCGALGWQPLGLHVTYLNAAGTGTMVRCKPWAKPDDEDPLFPKRKMMGPVGGGCVLLGDYAPGAALYVGEGNETVLSAMALAGADQAAVGVATLSLDNLQGAPRLIRSRTGGRIWPLYAIEPDPQRPCFTISGHRGAVTGLIDSDMAPLKGMYSQQLGHQGEAVIEQRRGPIVNRAITGGERAVICAELFVKGWRAAGAHRASAMRAPLGMDFNDAIQGEAA